MVSNKWLFSIIENYFYQLSVDLSLSKPELCKRSDFVTFMSSRQSISALQKISDCRWLDQSYRLTIIALSNSIKFLKIKTKMRFNVSLFSANPATGHNMDKVVCGRFALPHNGQVAEGAFWGDHPHRRPQLPHHPHHHPNKVLGGVRRHRGGCGDHGQKYWKVPRIWLCEWKYIK